MARTPNQTLDLRLFGGPYVSGSNGSRVSLSPTQLAFLAVVATEQRVSRPRVARVLWRREADPKIRHRIRQLLHMVNTRLGGHGIASEGDWLILTDQVTTDLAGFRTALDEGPLRPAATAFAEGFLARTFPAVAGEYRDWADRHERELGRQLRDAARAKWRQATDAGRWADARDAAECLYSLEPTNESVVADVIEARARLGRLGSAEAAYAQYASSLPGDVEPGPRATAVIERVRELKREQTARGGGKAPFVGRVEALAAGRAALDRVAAGEFACFLVVGESGIGKTRLLEEIEKDAVLRDIRCLRASPVELEQRIPLNPLLDALRDIDLRPHLEALGPPWSTVVNATLPPGSYDGIDSELPPIQETSLPRRLLDAFALLLESLALERPTVFFLDDLQWADETTVTALQFFQRRWTKGPFGVFASVRPELVSEETAAGKYVSDQAGLDVNIAALGELSQNEAHDLVRAAARQSVGDRDVDRLCRLGGFHPLFITELTRDFLAGRLRLPELPSDQIEIPVSLQEILRSRIGGLTGDARRLSAVLAVSGRPMKLADLANILGINLDKCADFIEDLERRRLVTVDQDRVGIAHDLFRSALYAQLTKARRAVLHAKLAMHLQRADEAAGELALHFARAGDANNASSYGWEAAKQAHSKGAMAEAAHFFELVVQNESDCKERAEATYGLAMSLYLDRNLTRAIPLLGLAAARLDEIGEAQRARRLDIHRAESLAAAGSVSLSDLIGHLSVIEESAHSCEDWETLALALNAELRLLDRSGDYAAIPSLFKKLERVARCGSRETNVLCNAGLALHIMFGDPDRGLSCARKAVHLAGTDSPHRLTALMRLLVVLQYQGLMQTEEAHAAISEARQLAVLSGDLWARFGIENNVALSFSDAGEIDTAEVLMMQAYESSRTAEIDLARFNLIINLAELSLARDDFLAAARWYCEAEACVRADAPSYAQDLVNAGIGLCALETGDLPAARRREALLNEPPKPWFYDPTVIVTFLARFQELRGNRPEAIQLLRATAEDLKQRHVPAWLKVTSLLVRLLTKAGEEPEARVRAREAERAAHDHGLQRRADHFRMLLEHVQR